ncbi:MAG: hypothetical protein D8M18_11190 [Bacteroidetes bacterium]|nr:hypothetical protein [Bacteroidota bacterium]
MAPGHPDRRSLDVDVPRGGLPALQRAGSGGREGDSSWGGLLRGVRSADEDRGGLASLAHVLSPGRGSAIAGGAEAHGGAGMVDHHGQRRRRNGRGLPISRADRLRGRSRGEEPAGHGALCGQVLHEAVGRRSSLDGQFTASTQEASIVQSRVRCPGGARAARAAQRRPRGTWETAPGKGAAVVRPDGGVLLEVRRGPVRALGRWAATEGGADDQGVRLASLGSGTHRGRPLPPGEAGRPRRARADHERRGVRGVVGAAGRADRSGAGRGGGVPAAVDRERLGLPAGRSRPEGSSGRRGPHPRRWAVTGRVGRFRSGTPASCVAAPKVCTILPPAGVRTLTGKSRQALLL